MRFSAYTYFDWMNPTTGNLVRYITTVLDDGSFEIKASTSPQDSRPFIGKTVTAAWVALTRGINEHMVGTELLVLKTHN